MLHRPKGNEKGGTRSKRKEKKFVYIRRANLTKYLQARYLTFPIESLRGDCCICYLRDPVPPFDESPLPGFS